MKNDEDDGGDKPVRVPIVLPGTHARLVTGLRRARSERISVIFMTALYFCLSSRSQIRWVSVPASWLVTPSEPVITIKITIQPLPWQRSAFFLLSFPDAQQINAERVRLAGLAGERRQRVCVCRAGAGAHVNRGIDSFHSDATVEPRATEQRWQAGPARLARLALMWGCGGAAISRCTNTFTAHHELHS